MLIAMQSVPMRYLSYWSDRAYRAGNIRET